MAPPERLDDAGWYAGRAWLDQDLRSIPPSWLFRGPVVEGSVLVGSGFEVSVYRKINGGQK